MELKSRGFDNLDSRIEYCIDKVSHRSSMLYILSDGCCRYALPRYGARKDEGGDAGGYETFGGSKVTIAIRIVF